MSDLFVAGLVVGIAVAFYAAAFVIYPKGSRPTDPEAPRRNRVYAAIVLVVAISFPVLIYDHYKLPRWLFGG